MVRRFVLLAVVLMLATCVAGGSGSEDSPLMGTPPLPCREDPSGVEKTSEGYILWCETTVLRDQVLALPAPVHWQFAPKVLEALKNGGEVAISVNALQQLLEPAVTSAPLAFLVSDIQGVSIPFPRVSVEGESVSLESQDEGETAVKYLVEVMLEILRRAPRRQLHMSYGVSYGNNGALLLAVQYELQARAIVFEVDQWDTADPTQPYPMALGGLIQYEAAHESHFQDLVKLLRTKYALPFQITPLPGYNPEFERKNIP